MYQDKTTNNYKHAKKFRLRIDSLNVPIELKDFMKTWITLNIKRKTETEKSAQGSGRTYKNEGF